MLDASLSNANISASGSDSGEDYGNVTNANTSLLRPSPSAPAVKSIPVVKWNVPFTGDVKQVSASAFLERIEELCIARHESKMNCSTQL